MKPTKVNPVQYRVNSKALQLKLIVSSMKSTTFLSIYFILIQVSTKTFAQSIGYHPNLFLGFNPYLSPVFGYGLGLPYGAHSHNGLNKPLITGSVHGGSLYDWLGKLHAKSIFKQLSYATLYPPYGSFKNKLALLKHPEYAYTPYGVDYGLGKHYGSAVIPNNPYKSSYGDYYSSPKVMKKITPGHGLDLNHYPDEIEQSASSLHEDSKTFRILKPLIKAGALITTAALLGKKTLEGPAIKLNPSGMIRDG